MFLKRNGLKGQIKIMTSASRFFGAQKIVRNKNFKVLSDKDLSFFESILSKNSVITDSDQIEPHNADWTKKFVG
jgi:hypothetical protein